MSWANANKLLAGFLAFLVSGMLMLGFVVYGAYGSYLQIVEEYESQVRELDRLQSLRPYPDANILKLEEEQRDTLANRIDRLQSRLAGGALPLIPLTSEQFQDGLRRAVSEAVEAARAQGTELPHDFYLGFQQYRDTIPPEETASLLGRELEAIKFVVLSLVKNRVARIVEVNRPPSSRAGMAGSGTETGDESVADTRESAGKSLVTSHSFQIGFTATQSAFRRVLNSIASTPRPFYIIDLLNVANEELVGPPRRVQSDASADGAASSERIQLIVGDEKVNVRMRIQIIDFADVRANSERNKAN